MLLSAFLTVLFVTVTTAVALQKPTIHRAQSYFRKSVRVSSCTKGASSKRRSRIRAQSTDDQQSEFEQKKTLTANVLDILFVPGNGQSYGRRSELHDVDARRSFSDPQIWTHAFFLLDGVLAAQYGHTEVMLLTLSTSPLSFLYHWTYEKPGILAQIESAAAKLCFIYGLVQIPNAPSAALAAIEAACAILTTLVFVVTNVKKELYDPWHCLMHIIPPIWVAILATSHAELLLPGGFFSQIKDVFDIQLIL